MKNRIVLKRVIISIVCVLVISGTFTLGFFTRVWTLDKDTRSVMYLIEKYKKYYLFEEDNIVEKISDCLLDDYSKFYTKEEYQSMKQEDKGNLCGFGISYNQNLEIVDVIGNSCAESSGVVSGGKIVAYKNNGVREVVDYTTLRNLLINAKENQSVTLCVDYNGVEKEHTITKKQYIRSYVQYADNSGYYTFKMQNNNMEFTKIQGSINIENPNIAYIKYSSFSGTKSGINGSVGQFEHCLNYLKNNNKTELILDLRYNGGGYVDILKDICKMIVPNEKNKDFVAYYSLDKHNKKTTYKVKNSTFYKYNISKITVLCNGGTASAAECLIGCMLDYSKLNNFDIKVIITGESDDNKTYGKGISQAMFLNSDGSYCKLTTEQLYFPLSNITIHKKGIQKSLDTRIYSYNGNDVIGYAVGI